ncbi:unnamed protein product [Prorocentrum cordatum]|uniref:Uncharacterized protein n=1 Tax=Prorocentrum cordatum TaxID=2364126 RepID=A0ABN9SUR4_9DINO|nr:unnamed protein product [Polarella glacialis]
MVESESLMAEVRGLGDKGHCQIYAVPVGFWKKCVEYQGREPALETSAMRKYFAEWGSENGTGPHVSITRDKNQEEKKHTQARKLKFKTGGGERTVVCAGAALPPDRGLA